MSTPPALSSLLSLPFLALPTETLACRHGESIVNDGRARRYKCLFGGDDDGDIVDDTAGDTAGGIVDDQRCYES